jgi:hypothetical protein
MRGAFHLIRTSAFPIEPGEDANTNPRVFGLSLANYLAAQMRLRGWSVESPRPEDFGYCIMLARKPFRLWIGCGNTGDRTDEWSAFAAAEGAFLKRTLGVVDPTDQVARVSAALGEIMKSAPGVTAYSLEQRD